jgi:hypothetical protein
LFWSGLLFKNLTPPELINVGALNHKVEVMIIIVMSKSISAKYIKDLKRQLQIELLSVASKMPQVTGSSGNFF